MHNCIEIKVSGRKASLIKTTELPTGNKDSIIILFRFDDKTVVWSSAVKLAFCAIITPSGFKKMLPVVIEENNTAKIPEEIIDIKASKVLVGVNGVMPDGTIEATNMVLTGITTFGANPNEAGYNFPQPKQEQGYFDKFIEDLHRVLKNKSHSHGNKRTIDKFRCDVAEAEGEEFAILPSHTGADRLKYNGIYLAYCSDGGMIENTEEWTDSETNEKFFRIHLNNGPLNTGRRDWIDIPISGTKEVTEDSTEPGIGTQSTGIQLQLGGSGGGSGSSTGGGINTVTVFSKLPSAARENDVAIVETEEYVRTDSETVLEPVEINAPSEGNDYNNFVHAVFKDDFSFLLETEEFKASGAKTLEAIYSFCDEAETSIQINELSAEAAALHAGINHPVGAVVITTDNYNTSYIKIRGLSVKDFAVNMMGLELPDDMFAVFLGGYANDSSADNPVYNWCKFVQTAEPVNENSIDMGGIYGTVIFDCGMDFVLDAPISSVSLRLTDETYDNEILDEQFELDRYSVWSDYDADTQNAILMNSSLIINHIAYGENYEKSTDIYNPKGLFQNDDGKWCSLEEKLNTPRFVDTYADLPKTSIENGIMAVATESTVDEKVYPAGFYRYSNNEWNLIKAVSGEQFANKDVLSHITAIDLGNIDENTAARHNHKNKEFLDSLSGRKSKTVYFSGDKYSSFKTFPEQYYQEEFSTFEYENESFVSSNLHEYNINSDDEVPEDLFIRPLGNTIINIKNNNWKSLYILRPQHLISDLTRTNISVCYIKFNYSPTKPVYFSDDFKAYINGYYLINEVPDYISGYSCEDCILKITSKETQYSSDIISVEWLNCKKLIPSNSINYNYIKHTSDSGVVNLDVGVIELDADKVEYAYTTINTTSDFLNENGIRESFYIINPTEETFISLGWTKVLGDAHHESTGTELYCNKIYLADNYAFRVSYPISINDMLNAPRDFEISDDMSCRFLFYKDRGYSAKEMIEAGFNTRGRTDFRSMFYSCQFDTESTPQETAVLGYIDTSSGKYFGGFADNAMFSEIGILDMRNMVSANMAFAWTTGLRSSVLRKIEKLIFKKISARKFIEMFGEVRDHTLYPSGDTYVSYYGFPESLEDITIEGKIVIDSNDLDLSYLPNLSAESLVSIFEAFEDNTGIETQYTVTIGTAQWEKLTEEQKAIVTNKNIILAEKE